jgi:hypothetical protein
MGEKLRCTAYMKAIYVWLSGLKGLRSSNLDDDIDEWNTALSCIFVSGITL